MELELNQSIPDRLFDATMDNLQDAWLIYGPTLMNHANDKIAEYEQTVEAMLRGMMNDYLTETN